MKPLSPLADLVVIAFTTTTPSRSQRRRAEARMKSAAGVPSHTPVSSGATPWGRDDAAWFKTHPGRAHRVRAAFPGERFGRPLDESAVIEAVAVRQIEPGQRTRCPLVFQTLGQDLFETMAGLIERAFHEEAAAHCVFDLTQIERWIPTPEVKAMIARYPSAPAKPTPLT